jgi:hypothetical protein
MLFTMYTVVLSLILATGLFAGKLDGSIRAPWIVLFIPVWIAAFVVTMFACFMLPGMVNKKVAMGRQAALLFVYVLTTISVTVVAAVKLDGNLSVEWTLLLIPYWIALTFHVASVCYVYKSVGVLPWLEGVIVTLILLGLLLVSIREDFGSFAWGFAFIPFWIL